MKLPSIVNAKLTLVQSPGFTDDYDLPETVGATKWTGSEDVYYSETLDHVMRGEREDRRGERDDELLRRYLVVDANLAVTFSYGDVVTIVRDGVTQNGNVRKVTTSKAFGVGVVRLVLEDA